MQFLIMDFRGVTLGDKGSTQDVVKGSKKEFPQELLEELKIICQVQNLILSKYFINLNNERRFRNVRPDFSLFANYN